MHDEAKQLICNVRDDCVSVPDHTEGTFERLLRFSEDIAAISREQTYTTPDYRESLDDVWRPLLDPAVSYIEGSLVRLHSMLLSLDLFPLATVLLRNLEGRGSAMWENKWCTTFPLRRIAHNVLSPRYKRLVFP